MKYLFCNRVNYTWAGFILSILLSNVAVLALLHTGLIQEAPNETVALVFASLVVTPLMQLARNTGIPMPTKMRNGHLPGSMHASSCWPC